MKRTEEDWKESVIRSATVRGTGECVAEREMRMHPLHGEGALRMEKGI